jgi:hypothetical protein
MIGIYQDDFIEYLKDRLGHDPKVTAKNIIVPCPWCEYEQDKDHYHLYIGIDAPIFHCFHGGCEKSGGLRKFILKLEGHDISESFVSKEELDKKRKQFVKKPDNIKRLNLPEIRTNSFPYKDLYIRKRLKFADLPAKYIKGLIFDVHEFLNINYIPIDETLGRLRDYLHNNFIGFVTERNSMVIFRNIDDTQSMKHYKLFIQNTNFLDYYRLPGNKKLSNKIVLAEGIFDIYTEQIFDFLNIKNEVALYASVHSSKYLALIKSIIFNEQIFQPDVVILSDNNIPEGEYKNLKKYNPHLFNTLTVYYNKYGKDFNETPVIPEAKFL